MAEEDILFGKKRHLFGGIEPSNMIKFSTMVDGDAVKIEAVLPKDTIVEGQTLCTVAGAVIRRKYDMHPDEEFDKYPKDEFDGEFVMDIKESGVYTDNCLVDSNAYYYAAFPYTTQGVYNRNESNRSMCVPKSEYYLFGYDLDTSDPDPATRVTYPSDVMNANYTPVSLNKSAKDFDYGSWNIEPGRYFMPRPCMLKKDGTVDHYLDPGDYTIRYNSETSSRVGDLSFDGNAMMEWPKIYTYREEVDGIYKFRCSNVKHSSKWECWCNYDKNDNEIDHFYTSIYRAALVSGTNVLRSISGANPTLGYDLKTTISYANNNGDGWTLETIVDRLLINDLLVMMGKTTNIQKCFGDGKFYNQTIAIGYGNDKGMFYGGDYSIPIKTFGMEDLWGNIPRRCVGWICDNGVQKIKMTMGKRDGSEVNEYNHTGAGYTTLDGVNITGDVPSYTYIKNMCTTPFGRIPILENNTFVGTSTTYECDPVSFLNKLSAPYLGGRYTSASDSALAGCFSAIFIDIANKDIYYGYGLSCKPNRK